VRCACGRSAQQIRLTRHQRPFARRPGTENPSPKDTRLKAGGTRTALAATRAGTGHRFASGRRGQCTSAAAGGRLLDTVVAQARDPPAESTIRAALSRPSTKPFRSP